MKSRIALSVAFIFASCFALCQIADQENAPSNPHRAVLERLAALTRQPLPDWRFHADIPHPEDPALNDSDWTTMKLGDKWHNGPRVLRRWIEIPKQISGYAIAGARVKLALEVGSEEHEILTVFSNGAVLARTDEDLQQPVILTERAEAGQKFLIAVRVDAANVETGLRRAELLIEPPANRPDPNLLREQILSAQPIIGAYEEGRAEREQQLAAAVKAIDFSALDHDDQAAFDGSLGQARTKLEALNPWLKQFTVHAIGNSHIDMAWLWPWTETVEVVRNTFQSVLDLMREYPEFKFTMSSARTYEWMEEKYPDLFQQIQQRVKEGRWEVIGGMWVEPDLNMPAGESLTRQILVGKRYFQKKFGVDIKIGWNPDSFGYNWQLPQIYKKSGVDYFVTQKLLWAKDFTTFPYKLFWWQAPDGSRLLTYFPHDYAGGIDAETIANDVAVWAPSIYGPRLTKKPDLMHLYGVGDHGGGPTRTMLDSAARLTAPDSVYPKLEFDTAAHFFDVLQTTLPSMKVPVWNDELYFQYHRGVLTTQAETKRRIRRTEEALLNAEKFSLLAMLYQRRYPQEQMERNWKRLLFDHFHDIMPGSGIAVNYVDAKRNLEDVRRSGDELIANALNEIAAHANTEGPGVPVVVFNSLSWPRTEVIEAEAQLPGSAAHLEVSDGTGKHVPSQLLSIDKETNRVRLLILTNTPALGYKIYFVRGTTSAAAQHGVSATPTTLENEFMRLKVDPHSGCMTSLFDKHSNSEALAPSETNTGGPKDSVCGNLLQTFVDKPKKWDAWNIDADFEDKYWDLNHADEVKLIEKGPLRSVIRVKQNFQNSTFIQDITMYAGVPRVDVKFHADWHEKHVLLKVAFPLNAHNDKARFEIPYGSIERPTTRNTPAEKAEFEVPALQWADISDATHGFSLLNDCKYGYDAKSNVLRLSLLRSPEWPDPHADEGPHDFTYSLYPHDGNWSDAQTVRRGYELNYKLFATQTEKHLGMAGSEHSFMQVHPDNVVVTAIKKAEDDDSTIIRFYEWAGQSADVRLQLPSGANSASDADLMERPINNLNLAVEKNVVIVATKPYEIKTVKVHLTAGERPHEN